jgi:serine/threonine-protein kinase RsbW
MDQIRSRNMKMTILERNDDITHVVLAGRLDTTGAEEIGASFSEVTAARKRPAIIDLSEIDFMASRGIGLLLASGKRLMQTGHKLVILNPHGMVESVLVTCRLDKVLPIAHNLDEAIQIVQGVSAQSGTASPPRATSADESRPQRSAPGSTAPSVSEGELKLAIKNELSELEGLNAELAQFLDVHGVPHRAAYAVNLAIDELVVNVMEYAYVDDDTHLIDIELVVKGDQVILRIVDDGRPFDPRTGPALDVHAENREVGRLGLVLVLDMVDALKYRRMDERNWVEVRVHLIGEGESSELSEARCASPKVSQD